MTAAATDFAKRLFICVDLVLDTCANVFGQSPCTASLSCAGCQCYNTIKTCQDEANYSGTTKTYRYFLNDSLIPKNLCGWDAIVDFSPRYGKLDPLAGLGGGGL